MSRVRFRNYRARCWFSAISMIRLFAVALFASAVLIGPAANSTGACSVLDSEGESESAPIGRTAPELLRCGPVALQLCSAICDRPLRADAIDEYFEPGSDENTLAEVRDAAHAVELHTLAVQWRRTLPPPNSSPAVIPIVNARGRRHFVAMAACRNSLALIVDVPQPPMWVSEEALRTKLHWHGEALHVAASDAALAGLRSEFESRGRYRAAAAGGVAVLFCLVGRTLRNKRRDAVAARVR